MKSLNQFINESLINESFDWLSNFREAKEIRKKSYQKPLIPALNWATDKMRVKDDDLLYFSIIEVAEQVFSWLHDNAKYKPDYENYRAGAKMTDRYYKNFNGFMDIFTAESKNTKAIFIKKSDVKKWKSALDSM